MWVVNTEAVFHCWCRCGVMASNSALGVVPMHWRTTTVCSLLWTTPDGNVCMYTTIEQLTKRRRMTAVEREALQISCGRCGQKFSRPQDLKRHNSQMPHCGTVKKRRTVAERAKLPFKCETCGERFSRQQDIARHKCSSSSCTTSSAVSQTK